jgi:hypothetical protein
MTSVFAKILPSTFAFRAIEILSYVVDCTISSGKCGNHRNQWKPSIQGSIYIPHLATAACRNTFRPSDSIIFDLFLACIFRGKHLKHPLLGTAYSIIHRFLK